MKKFFIIIAILSLTTISCKKATDVMQNLPSDIEKLRTLLKTKKTDLHKIEKDINIIQEKIDSIDPKSKRKTLVTAFSIKKSNFNRFSEIQGTVQSDEIVKISAEIPGRLLNVYVENGDKVRKGQLIAKIDVESTNKKLEELEKGYELAKDIFERQDRLWKKNIGSEIQYLSAKNNKERLEKSIASVKFQLRKANIYAPANGVIDRKGIEPGEMVSPGFPLMIILNTKKIKVVADVPETFLTKIKKREIISIKFPALDIEANGKVARIGSTINPTNRTFSIEIKINNTNNNLKPNLLAILLINDYSEKDVIVLPSELIQHEISGKPFVMLALDNEYGKTATKTYVIAGEEYDGNTIITSGLNEADIVIDKGARSVVDKEMIQIEKENANK